MTHGLRKTACNALVLAVALFALGAPVVQAEPSKQDAAGQQALRKAQGLLRDLTQQKSALEAERNALKEQVAKLEGQVKQLEPLQGELEHSKQSLAALRGSNGSLESQLGNEREKYQALQAKLKDIVDKAKAIQGDNQLLVGAVKEREQWISQCGERNRGLVDANQSLVERYRKKGFWDRVAELEPVTGIGKVQAENDAQEYRFKLEDLRMTPYKAEKTADASAAAPAPASVPQEGADDDAGE